jgi:hypothetical protein
LGWLTFMSTAVSEAVAALAVTLLAADAWLWDF